jgi:hypothetical protein
LAESELGPWLDPERSGTRIDLHEAWTAQSVIYLRLDADRYPLASEMLGAAIVSDLVALTGELQGGERRGLVAIDEFAAIGARNVLRVLSRSRSAGISVLLATQGVADLEDIASEGAPESFARRVLTQLDYVVAHRQPESTTAESLARLAGTQPVWVTTRRIDARFSAKQQESVGTRTREREFIRNPDEFKRLATGEAIVIEPASERKAERVRIWPPAHVRAGGHNRRHHSGRQVGSRPDEPGIPFIQNGVARERGFAVECAHAHRREGQQAEDSNSGTVRARLCRTWPAVLPNGGTDIQMTTGAYP